MFDFRRIMRFSLVPSVSIGLLAATATESSAASPEAAIRAIVIAGLGQPDRRDRVRYYRDDDDDDDWDDDDDDWDHDDDRGFRVDVGVHTGRGGFEVGFGTSDVEPDVAIEAFYDELSPHGEWVVLPRYGRCWIPAGVPVGWRPYTDGRWVYTDCGWTWESVYEWGWVPFHYGRWAYEPGYGWVWVPGSEWAPAWVAWRESDDYVGWAPLPPGVSPSATQIDFHLHVGDSAWNFVALRDFDAPHVHRHVVARPHVHRLVRSTRNVTHYTVVNRRVHNHSLPIHRVERVIRRPVVQHRIREVHVPSERRVTRIERNEVTVVRPNLRELASRPPSRARTFSTPPPRERERSIQRDRQPSERRSPGQRRVIRRPSGNDRERDKDRQRR